MTVEQQFFLLIVIAFSPTLFVPAVMAIRGIYLLGQKGRVIAGVGLILASIATLILILVLFFRFVS